MLHQVSYAQGIEIRAPISEEFAEILTPAAMDFVALLEWTFRERHGELLQRRARRQSEIDAGKMPDFLPETAHIRESDWSVAPVPADLQDRRVSITGPAERKMIINALNSGAKVFMADFEDSLSPPWEGTIQGQLNLRDAIKRTCTGYLGYPFENGASKMAVSVRFLCHLPNEEMAIYFSSTISCLRGGRISQVASTHASGN